MNPERLKSFRRICASEALLSGAGTAVAVGLRLPSPLRLKHPLTFAASVLGGASLIGAAARRPVTARTFAANLAAAAALFVLGAPSAVRGAALAQPLVAAFLMTAVLVHLVWSGLVAWQARAGLARLDSFQARAEGLLGFFVSPTLARLAAAETTVIRYALAFRPRPQISPGSAAFSYHRNGVLVLVWTVAALSCVEAAIVHLLMARWNGLFALISTGLTELSVLYLLGIANSLHRLPVLVGAGGVRLRTGILIDHSIPISEITEVRTLDGAAQIGGLRLSGVSSPNLQLVLKRPTVVRRLFKPERTSDRLNIYLDDPVRFCEVVRMHMVAKSA